MNFRAGDFEIDERLKEIRRDGIAIHIQPKAFGLILHLARNCDRVVSATELRNELWPNLAVGEAALRQVLLQARKALRDDRQKLLKTVKGHGYRLFAFPESVREPSIRAAPPAFAGTSGSRMFGRASEFARLLASLSDANDGSPRLCLLTGEAGIGKTRLLEELSSRARSTGFEVVLGRCAEEAGAPEYWPWVQIVRHIRGLPVVERRGASHLSELSVLLPELVTPTATPSPMRQSPEQAQFRLFDAVCQLLGEISQSHPLAVVFDDLHWADVSSILLLRSVVRSLRSCRLLFAGAYRDSTPEFHGVTANLIDSLARNESVRVEHLGGLSTSAVAQMVEAETGHVLAAAEADELREWTGGNPFFLTRVLPVMAGKREAPDMESVRRMSREHGVYEAVRAQLSELSESCRAVLELAAVIGREFTLDALHAALGVAAEAAVAALGKAIAARLVVEDAARPLTYRFVHALVREVLYTELPPLRRTELHRTVGLVLEPIYGRYADLRHAELAHHFYCARSIAPRKAYEYAVRAGRSALSRLAHEDALAHFQRALDVVPLVPEPDGPGRDELTFAALLGLGAARMAAGQRRDARETFRDAARLARTHGWGQKLARVALELAPGFFAIETGVYDAFLVDLLREALVGLGDDDPALRARLLARLAFALYYSGAVEERERLSVEAVACAEAVADASVKAFALSARHAATWGPDNVCERFEFAKNSLELARSADDPDTTLVAHLFLVADLLELGRTTQLSAEVASFSEFVTARTPSALWSVRLVEAMLAFAEGRLDEAAALANTYRQMGERVQGHNAKVSSEVHLALVLCEKGRAADIVAALRKAVSDFSTVLGWRALLAYACAAAEDQEGARAELSLLRRERFGSDNRDMNWLATLAWAALACRWSDDRESAGALYELMQPHAGHYVIIGYGLATLGAAARYLGLLASVLSEVPGDAYYVAASRHLHAAVDMNRRAGFRGFLAWTEFELGALLAQARDERSSAIAAELVAKARSSAKGLGMDLLQRRLRQAGSDAEITQR